MSILRSIFLAPFFLISLSGCNGKSIESYIADLSHPTKKVRLKASYELVISGAAAVEPLLAHAASGSDSLQFISAQVLGRIGDKRAIPLLRQLAGSPTTLCAGKQSWPWVKWTIWIGALFSWSP